MIRWFRRGRRENGSFLEGLTSTIASLRTVDEAASMLLSRLREALGAQRGAFFVKEPSDVSFRLVAEVGFDPPLAVKELEPSHPLIPLLGPMNPLLMRAVSQAPTITGVDPEAMLRIQEMRGEIFAGVPGNPGFAGILVLGAGSAEHSYGDEERDLLHDLMGPVAAALETAMAFAETERRTRQMEVLHEAARSLASTLDLEAVLHTLVASARKLVGARFAALAAFDKRGDLSHFVHDGLTPYTHGEITRKPSGRGLLGMVLKEGELLRLDEISRDPRAAGFPDGHPVMKNMVMVPIAAHGRVFGNLYVTEKANGQRFTGEDEKQLLSLAADGALALENARLFHETQLRLTKLQALYDVSERLARAQELDAILQVVADRGCVSVPPAEVAIIHMVDPTSGGLSARAVAARIAVAPDAAAWDLVRIIALETLQTGRMTYIPDVSHRPGLPIPALSAFRSMVSMPLIVGDEGNGNGSAGQEFDAAPAGPVVGEVLGVLCAASALPNAFDDDSLRLLATLSHQAAVAMSKARITTSLRQSLEALEQRSIELEASLSELRTTQSQLVQAAKLASLGTLSAGIAHELNNPLAGIKLHTQNLQLLRQRTALTDELLIENLLVIDELVDKASRIIQLFRTFARQSTGKHEAVDVNVPIDEALSMLGEQLRLRDIRVIREATVRISPVLGDPNQLEQVVVNLINNARDAMDRAASKELRLRTFETGGWVTLEVADTGCGIPASDRDRIFDPFYTTKEVGRGTGLGLSITHRIVENHGGRIEVDDNQPTGTVFRVILPRAKETSRRPS